MIKGGGILKAAIGYKEFDKQGPKLQEEVSV
jgi:hypothetical protein